MYRSSFNCDGVQIPGHFEGWLVHHWKMGLRLDQVRFIPARVSCYRFADCAGWKVRNLTVWRQWQVATPLSRCTMGSDEFGSTVNAEINTIHPCLKEAPLTGFCCWPIACREKRNKPINMSQAVPSQAPTTDTVALRRQLAINKIREICADLFKITNFRGKDYDRIIESLIETSKRPTLLQTKIKRKNSRNASRRSCQKPPAIPIR